MKTIHLEMDTLEGRLNAEIAEEALPRFLQSMPWIKTILTKGNEAEPKKAQRNGSEDPHLQHRPHPRRGLRRGGLLALLQKIRDDGPMTTQEIGQWAKKWGVRGYSGLAYQTRSAGYLSLRGDLMYLTPKGVKRANDNRLIALDKGGDK